MEKSSKLKHIVLTGPESTGKTVLSEEISRQLNTHCYPEYAREYVAKLKDRYTFEDLCIIAREQQRQMQLARLNESSVVVFDTYLIITKIWFQVVFGSVPEWIDEEIDCTRTDTLYLLCKPDIPWKPDKLRENGGEQREILYQKYKAELEQHKLNYCYIHGSGNERIMNAMRCVKQFI